MRKPMIAGNWKMHLNSAEAAKLAAAIKNGLDPNLKHDVLLAPSFTNLEVVRKETASSPILLSAQNMCWEEKGAFTGEVSGSQLKDAGCDYVIIGHSERRKIFLESDEVLNKKLKAAFKFSLKAIFCIGETLEERENNQTYEILQNQLQKGLKDISAQDVENIVIAYEPVWAIGTGKTATPQQAQESHIFIRKELSKMFGEGEASKIRILYGGSVKAENIDELMSQPDIDGALVGGESLKAEKFLRVIHYQSAVNNEKIQ